MKQLCSSIMYKFSNIGKNMALIILLILSVYVNYYDHFNYIHQSFITRKEKLSALQTYSTK